MKCMYDFTAQPIETKRLTEEETTDLIKKAKSGDIIARNTLIEYNIRLIYKYALEASNKIYNRIEPEEFLTPGTLGMIKAIEMFKFDAGTKFSTYAVIWIKQFIARYINNFGTLIRLPVHVIEKENSIRRAMQDYIYEFEKEPTMLQLYNFVIAHKEYYLKNQTDKTANDLIWVIINRIYSHTVSLNTLAKSINNYEANSANSEVQDLILDEETLTPEEEYLLKERKDIILKTLHECINSTRDLNIILDKYGFNDTNTSLSLTELGKKYKLTTEGVRQIIKKQLQKLRCSGKLDIYAEGL